MLMKRSTVSYQQQRRSNDKEKTVMHDNARVNDEYGYGGLQMIQIMVTGEI